MQEILPGLFHFSQKHEHIGVDVSSYYLYAERVLTDPMTPDVGIAWFTEQEQGPPTDILLSCRHHYRHSAEYVDAFGTTVHCVSQGMHEFAERELPAPVMSFEFGDTLPGDVVAIEVDSISPDETAFHLPRFDSMLIADGVIGYDPNAGLSFVPDFLMDDPPGTKRGLVASFRRLLELDWQHLLLAHGPPRVGTGRAALEAFVSENS